MTNYNIKLCLDLEKKLLIGQTIISFANKSSLPIYSIFLRLDSNVSIHNKIYRMMENKECYIEISNVRDSEGNILHFNIEKHFSERSYCKVNLNSKLNYNQSLKIYIQYTCKYVVSESLIRLEESFYGGVSSYPRLIESDEMELGWLDYNKCNYQAEIIIPSFYKVITSGNLIYLDNFLKYKKYTFIAKNIPSFGVILSDNLNFYSNNIKGINILSWYRDKTYLKDEKERAKKLLGVVEECVEFMFQKFEFYPQTNINIVPGFSFCCGGYATSNIIVIHDYNNIDKVMQQFTEETFSKYIIAHELAHMYFGMHVTDDNYYPKWLTIGLSMWFDKMYTDHLGITCEYNFKQYYEAKSKGYNTTIMEPVIIREGDNWNWNNVISHDKSYLVLIELEKMLGKDRFYELVKVLLKNYSSKVIKSNDIIKLINRYNVDIVPNIIKLLYCD